MDDDLDLAVETGDIDASQYAALVGPSYAQNQTAFDAADNGTIQNSGTPLAPGVMAVNPTAASNPAPAGGASYTPPSFWQQLTTGITGLATAAGTTKNALSPLIGGTPAPAAATAAAAGSNTTMYLALGAGAIVLLLLLKK